jgi:UDP-N-acetylmuramyl-tripeptide synthetase
MQLRSLLEHLEVRRVQGDLDRVVRSVTRDTRELVDDGVFVAICGARVDGHELVDRAAHAAAIVVQRPVAAPGGPTVVEVADTKRALAALAAAYHGHPGAAMKVVGVTGTNGKTTVTTLVEEALREAGVAAGRIGTTGTSMGGEPMPSPLTTPEAPYLQSVLARMRDSGTSVVAMEASSVGLAQHRVDGIAFHLGVFTNLSRDHLDFHADMDAYRLAKARLFAELLRAVGGPPRALLCGDDPARDAVMAPPDRWLYGFSRECDLRVTELECTDAGLRFTLRTPAGTGKVHSPLVGRFNAQNLAAAVGCCLAVGLGLPEATGAVSAVQGVSGRLEPVENDRGLLVLVDYAHTPDALASSLRAVHAVARGEVWVVFGCGGNRDPGKRPEMGRAAEEGADRVVVTSDNPRSEDPLSIVEAILSGMETAPAHVDPNRGAAIAWVLHRAAPGDAVLIAGKGHETYQEVGGAKHPFDDREVARNVLRSLAEAP